MIFSNAKVYGPNGAIEARNLKDGDPVWSWQGGRWRPNQIRKISRGQSRTAFSIFAFDGTVPMHLRCSMGQLLRVKGTANIQSESVRAGQAVFISEGAHIFRAKVGAVIKETMPQPADTFGIELAHAPRNVLIDGFLCNA